MLPPKLDPNCNCICLHQEGIVHFAPCCRETDPHDDEIARLTAERDQALARAAAAAMEMRERAAKKCKWHSDKLVETIRALPIDPDAQKALDEMLAKAREDAIRLSASIAKAWKTFDGEDYRPVEAVILALLNDGGRDE